MSKAKSKRQGFIIEGLIIGILAGVTSGIIVSCTEESRVKLQKESEIIFADEHNSGIACAFTRSIDLEKNELKTIKYVVEPYFTNFDFISNKPKVEQELIHTNIFLMNASNNTTDLFFQRDRSGFNAPNENARQVIIDELRTMKENIKTMSEQIYQNIQLYNKSLSEINCENRVNFYLDKQ